ncbi:hypothetical protein [Chryseobacterium sp. MP_3.2]|uniref:hypothetical protein n=1 Tax=Chryseobacterium sp. MP_3.2 TaxID=3071712 RepID=UPI002DFCAE36|nr:hypothetical protein [Chryseobacterium sp. MP_3.2]
MKKILLILPLLIISCTKKDSVTKTTENQDSLKASDQIVVENLVEPVEQGVIKLNENPTLKEVSKTFRVLEGNKIVKTLNGDMIPLKITEEFTADQSELILKIKNFSGKKINGQINPSNPQMNIRFNQIKLPNGTLDGPFSRDLVYDIKESGEIWLMIGKNNMASGETTGKFNVTLK